ncbi:hypothetical protein M9458_009551, partial [Cirrhinus mrigala]
MCACSTAVVPVLAGGPNRERYEQLLVELKAGGIRPEHEALRSLDLLDFLAHLPLFILIHNSVIANPFDDSSNL